MDGKPYTSNKPPYGDGVNIINTSSQLAWTGVWPKFNQVNHNPVAILNGDRSKQIVKITTKSRDNIKLTAVGSSDPDDNKISQQLDDLQGSQYILKRRKTYPTPQSPPGLQAFFCTLPSSETRR